MNSKISQYRFLEKTVLMSTGVSFVALASLFIVGFFIPTVASADEIVYFEDFDDSVFNNCTALNGSITSGSAYSGTKKLENTSTSDCATDLATLPSDSIITYTFYFKELTDSSTQVDFDTSGLSSVFDIRLNGGTDDVCLTKNGTCTPGANAVIIGQSTGSWQKVQIVLNGDSAVARLDDAGAWYQLTLATSTPASRVSFSNTGSRIAIDDLSIYTGDSIDAVDSSSECDTCSRIISTDPYRGETLASTTSGYQVNVEYYVSDSLLGEDDFCNSLFGIGICTTKISVSIKKAASIEVYTFIEEVPDSGENLFFHFFSQVDDLGTYILETRIYNSYIGSSYVSELNEDIVFDVRKFYVGTSTSQEDIDAYWDGRGFGERIDLIEEGSLDVGTVTQPGTIATAFGGIAKEFLLMPPWGYITVFNETLQNGTSTAIGTMALTFSTSSPAYGQTLSLPITGASENGIQYLRDHGVTGVNGDSWDTALYYWNLFFYIAFIIWVMREVFGLFNGVDLGSSSQSLDLSRSRVSGGSRVDNKSSTLDLRK